MDRRSPRTRLAERQTRSLVWDFGALVHGIAKLILEGGVQPSEYGFKNGLALAVRVLGQRVE